MAFRYSRGWCFYPGGRGSDAPPLGTCCLGLAPSVVAVALLLLLPLAPPEAFGSPCAGEEEDEEEVVLVVAAIAEDVIVEEVAAAVPSEGLAAEEEAGACVEAGSGSDVLFGVASRSGTLASWLQSLLSSAGGSTSAVDKYGSAAASQESPLTTVKE